MVTAVTAIEWRLDYKLKRRVVDVLKEGIINITSIKKI